MSGKIFGVSIVTILLIVGAYYLGTKRIVATAASTVGL